MTERNLHAIDTINRRIAGRSTSQNSNACLGNKAHVHEVVLHGFGQSQIYEYCVFTNLQLAQTCQRPLPAGYTEQGRSQTLETTTRIVRNKNTPEEHIGANCCKP